MRTDAASIGGPPVFERFQRGLSRLRSIPTAESIVFKLLMAAIALLSATVFLIALKVVTPDAIVGDWALGLDILQRARVDDATRSLVVAGASLMTGAGALAMLFWSRSGGSPRAHLVDADESGFVMIDSDGVESLAAHAARRAPGVVDVEVNSRASDQRSLRLTADVAVHARSNPKEAGRIARQSIVESLEEHAGLSVRDVRVNIHILEPNEMVFR